jgi:hypothetical protein
MVRNISRIKREIVKAFIRINSPPLSQNARSSSIKDIRLILLVRRAFVLNIEVCPFVYVFQRAFSDIMSNLKKSYIFFHEQSAL